MAAKSRIGRPDKGPEPAFVMKADALTDEWDRRVHSLFETACDIATEQSSRCAEAGVCNAQIFVKVLWLKFSCETAEIFAWYAQSCISLISRRS